MGVGGRENQQRRGDWEGVETEKQAELETQVGKNSGKGEEWSSALFPEPSLGPQVAKQPPLLFRSCTEQAPRHFVSEDGFIVFSRHATVAFLAHVFASTVYMNHVKAEAIAAMFFPELQHILGSW